MQILLQKYFYLYPNICLSSFLVELLDSLHPTKLVRLKLVTMSDIVHSQIFLNADCRAILLPCIIVRAKELLHYPDFVSVPLKL